MRFTPRAYNGTISQLNAKGAIDMSRFQEKLWKWMAGRYGMDALYYALLVLSLVFWGIHLFAPHWI